MSKKPSRSARTTVYRLRGLTTLSQAVLPKYLLEGSFSAQSVTVGGHDGFLVTGTMRRQRVPWASRLSAIAGTVVDLGSAYAAALLLIKEDGDQAWAITYGLGFQLFDRAFLDPGFGIQFATRTARPEAVQSLTRSELDHRARTDRSSIPAGTNLHAFGIGGFGEVVTRISGSAEVGGLTVGDRRIRVHAADSLSLPLGKTPEALVEDLKAISTTLRLDPKPELRVLDQLVRVKHRGIVEKLETELRSAILYDGQGKIALGWPHERVSDNGTPLSYKVIGTGRRGIGVTDDLPTLAELIRLVVSKNKNDPLSAAKTIKLRLFRDGDGEEPMSGDIPVINWLFYEVELDSIRYCLFDSHWYAMDTDYAYLLDSRIRSIFARQPPVDLPDWDTSRCADEGAYNEMAAPLVGGVMLDRRLLRTRQNPRGFEACDIITSTGGLIHVKHVDRSSKASHLIAQAIVATDALRHDNEARQRLRDAVVDAGGDAEFVQDRPSSVVLGMARAGSFDGQGLFSFTQVTLARLDMSLADIGVELSIAPIRRS